MLPHVKKLLRHLSASLTELVPVIVVLYHGVLWSQPTAFFALSPNYNVLRFFAPEDTWAAIACSIGVVSLCITVFDLPLILRLRASVFIVGFITFLGVGFFISNPMSANAVTMLACAVLAASNARRLGLAIQIGYGKL